MRFLGWALIQSDSCPHKKRKFRHWETLGLFEHRKKTMWAYRERGAPCKPRSEVSESTLLTPWPWTYSLQNCEEKKHHCLCHPVCGFCSGSPSKRIQEGYVPILAVVIKTQGAFPPIIAQQTQGRDGMSPKSVHLKAFSEPHTAPEAVRDRRH